MLPVKPYRDRRSPVTVVITGARDPTCVSGSGKDQLEYDGMVTGPHLFQTPTPYPSSLVGVRNTLINKELFRWLL